MRVCILGLGYIGLPTAIAFAQSGIEVRGVDINQKVVSTLRSGGLPIDEPGLDDALASALASGLLSFDTSPATADAYIITVQTPQRPDGGGMPVSELSYVRNAARDVGSVLKPGQLVILESTVPPLTTRIARDEAASASGLSVDSFLTAHCPERVIPGRILTELRENDRIIGADTPESGSAAKALYERILTTGRIFVTDTVTAELCKLAENTFRDINIAYANELSLVCHKLGVDVYNLIALANRHPRVNIHSPGVGVGGHCIAVDPWFIRQACPEDTRLITTARQVNDDKPSYIASRVAESVDTGRHVCVLGLAYKPDVDDLRESPALKLCQTLRDMGYSVRACEPHVRETRVSGFENVTLESALESGDYLVLAMGHTLFKNTKKRLLELGAFDCVGMLRD